MKRLMSMLLVLSLCLGLLSLTALAGDEAVVPEITPEAAGSEPEETQEEMPANTPEETPGEGDCPAEPEEPAAEEEIVPAAEPAPAADAAAGGRENAGGDGKYRTEETPSSVLADAAALDGFDIIQGFYLELVRSELSGPAASAVSHTFLLDYPGGFDQNDYRVYRLNGGTAEVLSDVSFGPCIELNGLMPENGEHIALAWNAVSDPGPGGPGGQGGSGGASYSYTVDKGAIPADAQAKLSERLIQVSMDFTDRITYYTVTLRDETGSVADLASVTGSMPDDGSFMSTLTFPVDFEGNDFAVVYLDQSGSAADLSQKKSVEDFGCQGMGPGGVDIDLGVRKQSGDSFAGTMYFAIGVRDTGGQGGPGSGPFPEVYEETPVQALVDRAEREGYEHTAGYILTHNLDYQEDSSGHIGEGMNWIAYPAGMDSSITDWKVYQLYDGTVTEADAELGGDGIRLRVRDVDLGRKDGEPYGPHFVVAWNGTAGTLIETSFTWDDDGRIETLRRAITFSGFDSGCMYAVSTMDKRTVAAGEYGSFLLWCPDDMDVDKPWGLYIYRDGKAVDVTDWAVIEQHKNGLALAVSGLDVENDGRFALGQFTVRSDLSRLEDKAAGIIVSGELSGAAELRVTPVTSGEGYALVQQQAGVTKLRVYDISLIKDGVEIQPSGWVRVTMSLPEGYDPDRTVLFHVEDDGTVMPIRFTLIEDGRIVFMTDSFSLYALGEMEQTPRGDVNGDGAVNRLDRVFFARCLAGWPNFPAPEYMDPAAADMNRDESVDLQDRSVLSRMLAADDPAPEE